MNDFLKPLFFKNLPEKWNTTKKLAFLAKQEVAHLQANEVIIIKRKIECFELQQLEFRETFQKNAPFKYEGTNPYKKLDNVRY